MKKHAWAIGFTACLTAFTVFLAMDTFVLSSTYQTNATQMNTAMIRQAEAENEAETGAAAKEGTNAEAGKGTGTEGSADQEAASSSDSTADQSVASAGDSGDGTDAASSATKQAGTDGSDAGGKPRKKPGSSDKSSGSSGSLDNSSGSSGSGSGRPSGKKHRKSSSGSSNGESAFRPSGDSPSVGGSGSSGASGSGKPSGKSGMSGGGSSGGRSSSTFNEEEAAKEAAAVTTDNAGSTNTYQDENVTINYTTYTTNGTTVHVADVQLSSIEYLKTAFAQDTYGKNVTQSTSDMAAAHDAVLAVNGDYYGVQERGYVIRNGIVYRDTAGTNEVLCIYGDGSMKVVDPSTVTAQELVDQGVWQAFSFGPGLLENGEISVALNSEVGKAKASNPRTAIGMIDELHYVFVVSDGRSGESEGLSLYELATFMQELGVQTAYNLDGGGSSTMYFNGEVVNDPAGGFGESERKVSDIVYIG